MSSNAGYTLESLVTDLVKKQPEYVAKGFAMMTFNPSIGRVLKRGAVDEFEQLAWDRVQKLSYIETLEDFDEFHDQFVSEVLEQVSRPTLKMVYNKVLPCINALTARSKQRR